jgi:hypothetical protein
MKEKPIPARQVKNPATRNALAIDCITQLAASLGLPRNIARDRQVQRWLAAEAPRTQTEPGK